MSLKSLLMPALSQRLLGERRLVARRAKAERRRVASGALHRVHCFHQVDDPYSALLAAVLPRLVERYDIELVAHVVGAPSTSAAPQRERLVAYSRRDAARLAHALGLGFDDPGAQPPAAAVAEAGARLVAAAESGRFVEVAGGVSDALWRGGTMPASAPEPASAERVHAHVRDAEVLRDKLGHYLGAMLFYAGEWTWGVDRLHHLERRLQALGAERGASGASGAFLFASPSECVQADEGRSGSTLGYDTPTLEFFVSLRSPYSAIATPRVFDLARATGAAVRPRYVLPMVMRGLPVPRAKRLYIAQDAAREARWRGVPFGRINDPVGRPTERGLALLAMADAHGQGEAFLRSFMQGVWAEGIDAGSDRGLRRIAERAGLSWNDAQEAMRDEAWRATAEANRAALFELGLWGVPSFRVGAVSTWGQDRLWLVAQALTPASNER